MRLSLAGRPHSTRGQPRSAPRSTLLYDSRRGVHYAKPLLRGWLHLVWFATSLVAGPLLLAGAHGVSHRIGVVIYAGCLSGLFGVSALYHRGDWGPVARRVLQRADHLMIFLLIAGTATPVFLLAVPGTYGVVCLIVLWSLTAVATGARLTRMKAPERLVGGAFLGLGAANALALPALWTNVGVAAAILVLAGGLLYITGAVAYHHRRPDPFPSCSAITRSSTPSCAPPPHATTWPSRCSAGSHAAAPPPGALPAGTVAGGTPHPC